MLKQKIKKSKTLTKFFQFWYLTFSNFNKNNLWDSACSCSFGFIFSFVPIVLIISSILIGVLKVSPNAIKYVQEFSLQIKDVIDIQPIIDNVLNLRSLRYVDIFLGFWIIWIARKLFLSIVRGMNSIFNSMTARKGIFTQALTFLSEFVLIFIFIAIIITTFTFRKLFENSLIENSLFSFFRESFPKLFRESSNIIFISVTYFLLFVFVFYIYKVVSGTKPKTDKCAFYAFLCTATFYVLSICLNLFMNISNYNLVYGTISTLIILMMKVYFFFVIFLYCAQMLYVSQFFDNLLLAELYLLPGKEERGFANTLRRKMFINSTVLQTEKNTKHYKEGDVIYSVGDSVTRVFYLRRGEVSEVSDSVLICRKKGAFFGELPLILNTPRNTTAMAKTDCEIMEIPVDKFLELVQENPRVSAQALSQISTYTAQ